MKYGRFDVAALVVGQRRVVKGESAAQQVLLDDHFPQYVRETTDRILGKIGTQCHSNEGSPGEEAARRLTYGIPCRIIAMMSAASPFIRDACAGDPFADIASPDRLRRGRTKPE
ncbi:hypothetical protein [Micromonospora sp. HK10]|uniref:hypothetical protein n=1 Tax=Micromonospora sp. HK10 TaxID=1538294 RepID=UPI001E3023F6|nr:hypothetical protein [Micromonospora sp. HK10]